MKNKKRPNTKSKLHPRNKHRQRYDFQQLIATCPALKAHVAINKYGDESINFFDAAAVKMLNKALLQQYYDVEYWDVPAGYLCPPIPGRADYIHYAADVMATSNKGDIPRGSQIKCLDIGVGANCVYPIIGSKEYGWSFIGSETDEIAIEAAQKIVDKNPTLSRKVEIRQQSNERRIFQGILKKEEQLDLVICNPPFHASLAEAQAGTRRKLRNLKQKRTKKPVLNFGGQNHELWCEGGEERFVSDMIRESQNYAGDCCWFSTLIAKAEHLPSIYRALEKAETMGVKTIPMGQGNKVSRIVAWTFLSSKQQQEWAKIRW